MKKRLTLFLLGTGIYLTSQATNYYIAASGNDGNNGTATSTPWKTITKLNASFSSLKPGDNVYLNRGDIFYGTITINKSGSSGSPITISAYGSGADPVVTGFTTVSGWTNLGSNIWESSSTVSNLSACNMVAINGVSTAMGRYPNSGYLTYVSASGNSSITCTTVGGTNWTGAEAVIKKNDYTLDRCMITGQSGSVINYTDAYTTDPGSDGYGFFIQNDVRTLDQQNEWYYNPSTRKIRVYSTSTPGTVQVASLSNLLVDNGSGYITVDNISFKGSSDDAVNINSSNANDCTVENCSISLAGANGIYLVNGNNCSINNNVLTDCNSTGIESDAGNQNVISNNTLTNMGVLIGQCRVHNTGIFGASQNIVIKYNSVQNAGYCGITIKAGSVTSLVQYNFVNNTGLVLDDGGGIYTSSPAQGGVRTIDHNIVLNSYGSRDGTTVTSRSLSAGIYCDDLTSNVVITNNTVAGSVDAGIKMHRSSNCTVNNNTSYNNTRWQIYFQNNSSTSDVFGITMKHNIFFSRNYSSSTLFQWTFGITSNINDITSIGTLDSNYYDRPISEGVTLDTYEPAAAVSRTLASWQSFCRQELHSKTSPVTVTDTNNIRLVYNATASSTSVSLGATYIDAKNNSYNGSITLAPYTSAVLIKTGASTNAAPVANAGANQAVTLPTNAVTLTGSGTDAGGTISAYSWTKIAGSSSGTITSSSKASTTVTSLVQGTYQFQLKVTSNSGATGLDTVQVTVNSAGNLLAAVNLSSPVNGINYTYFEGSDYTAVPAFSTLTPLASGTSLNFGLSPATRTYGFAFDFTGYIYVPTDGQYTFYTNSDDGSTLYIDGTYVVNNDGTHTAKTASGSIGLKAGYHAITVGYFQQFGGSSLSVSYSGPGIVEEVIPSSQLYVTVPSGLLPAVNPSNLISGVNYSYYQAATYISVPAFASLKPVSTGTTSTFTLSVAQRADDFALQFTGYIDVPTDGQYTFYTNSDDGSNLYIDNVLVVNNDYVHPPLEYSGTIGLKAGKHAISVGYFQQTGGSELTVSYAGPGISKQAVPASVLYGVAASGGNVVAMSNLQAISDVSMAFALKAFPNPFLNEVNVAVTGEAGPYKLTLVDVSGKIIWTATGTKNAGEMDQIINTSALQRGIYFLQLHQNNNTTVFKLVRL